MDPIMPLVYEGSVAKSVATAVDDESGALLKVDGVVMRFGGLRAIENLSMTAQAGEVT